MVQVSCSGPFRINLEFVQRRITCTDFFTVFTLATGLDRTASNCIKPMNLQLSLLSVNWIPSAGVNGPKSPLIPQYQTPHMQPCTPPVWWPAWSWSASCGATCEDCSSRHESCLASHRRAALLFPAYTGGPDQHTLTHHQTIGGPPSLTTSASHLGSGSHCCSARHFWLRRCLFLLYLIQLLLHPSGLCIIVRLVPSALKKSPSFLQMETTILLQHLHILTHG